MENPESTGAPAPRTRVGLVQGYFLYTRSSTMLVHGIVVQLISGVLVNLRSAAAEATIGASGVEKFFSTGWLATLAMNWATTIGWALVAFACAKVIAEALRER